MRRTAFRRFVPDAAGMAGEKGDSDRNRRLQTEKRRRAQALRRHDSEQVAGPPTPAGAIAQGPARRAAAVSCAWCGAAITPGCRGPLPKWCSVGCRRRAWEQGRAAASGRSAIEVVERRVEVRVPCIPTRRDWLGLLSEFAAQVDDGRVYDRDLAVLAPVLRGVMEAVERRARTPW